jgi:hypothetical protein
MRKLPWILAPFAAGLLALVVACGGDDGGQSNSDNSTTGGSGSSVSQELNLAEAATQLMELRSFRFNVSLKLDLGLGDLTDTAGGEDDEFGAALADAFLALFSDISAQGAYVAPDSFDVKIMLAGEEAHMIQIGDEAWVNDGSGWVATDPSEDELTPFGSPTDLAFDFLPDEVLQNAEISSEKVNGVNTTKYHFDKASLEAVAADLGESTGDMGEVDEITLDAWLAEGNIPVKIALKASGTNADGGSMSVDVAFEISDINADISIDRPI